MLIKELFNITQVVKEEDDLESDAYIKHSHPEKFKEFKDALEAKYGKGNIRYSQGSKDVTDAYNRESGQHLGFIDGRYFELEE